MINVNVREAVVFISYSEDIVHFSMRRGDPNRVVDVCQSRNRNIVMNCRSWIDNITSEGVTEYVSIKRIADSGEERVIINTPQ